MVRHKARWLLVQVDFDKKQNSSSFPSKKDFALMIRSSISSCFGLAADGAAMETQGMDNSVEAPALWPASVLPFLVICFVRFLILTIFPSFRLYQPVRFVDPTTRLVLLRVPREFCNMVRCSITMLTRNISEDVAAIKQNDSKGAGRRPTLVASIISVNGSARTAKLSTMARIRKVYRQRLLDNQSDPRVLEEMHSLLNLVQNID